MIVQPVKYKPENVVEVKPGDVIPEKSIVFHEDGHQWMPACEIIASHNVTHYAPAPILDLPPEPQEVELGEAMRRIKDGDRIGWKRGADLGQVVYLRGGNLMVSRPLMPDTCVTNFGVLVEGTFYEIPEATEPEPKTTGLKWWEAIEAIRGTSQKARHANVCPKQDQCCYARWESNTLVDCEDGDVYELTTWDMDAEWDIVE